jgi:hypothetical protein
MTKKPSAEALGGSHELEKNPSLLSPLRKINPCSKGS